MKRSYGLRMLLLCVLFVYMWMTMGLVMVGQTQSLDNDALKKRFEVQHELNPQERIYVMTDRDDYICGDTLWLRGFLLDAATHELLSLSRYMYVELRNPQGTLLSRIKLRGEEQTGVFQGYLFLNEEWPEGQYTLAAYTYHMKGLGERYFFKKPVKLISPYAMRSKITMVERKGSSADGSAEWMVGYRNLKGENMDYSRMTYSWSDGRGKKRQGKKGDVLVSSRPKSEMGDMLFVQFDNYAKYLRVPVVSSEAFKVVFHPEGGSLVAGESCRVAFRVSDTLGRGVFATGELLDSSGAKLCAFKTGHEGIGEFLFRPEMGTEYHAICHFSNGESRKIVLPPVTSEAVALHVKTGEREVSVAAVGRIPRGSRLILTSGGQEIRSFLMEEGTRFSFLSADLPVGVIRCALIDSDAVLLSERLFFVSNSPLIAPVVQTEREKYASRERISVRIILKDSLALRGTLSVSVTDDAGSLPRFSNSFASEMLLLADLSEPVFNADYYFVSGEPGREAELDALMLMQSGIRCDLSHLLRDNPEPDKVGFEQDQVIRGYVNDRQYGRSSSGGAVFIVSPAVSYANVIRTEKDGRFLFDNMDYPDGTSFALRAESDLGYSTKRFALDTLILPQQISSLPDLGIEAVDSAYLNHAYRRLQFSRGMPLDNVSVTALKEQDEDAYFYRTVAKRSYTAEEIKRRGYSSLSSLIHNIPGVRIVDDNKVFYGPALLSFSSPRVATNDLRKAEMVHPIDYIKQVDLVMVYGSVRPFIRITPYKAHEWPIVKEKSAQCHVFTPLGYQLPESFYSPDYVTGKTLSDNGADMRATLYWNPSLELRDGVAVFEFYASDAVDTSYTIRVEGVSETGQIIQAEKTILKE